MIDDYEEDPEDIRLHEAVAAVIRKTVVEWLDEHVNEMAGEFVAEIQHAGYFFFSDPDHPNHPKVIDEAL